MTKDNAKGLTYGVCAKLNFIIEELCDSDLIEAQKLDADCNVESMGDAVGLLCKARNELRRAYHYKG